MGRVAAAVARLGVLATCSRRCCSSPRWASGSATSSTRARAASTGVDYLVFVTPGLMAASAVMQAAGESLWPVMGGVKWLRHVPRGGGDAGRARATCTSGSSSWTGVRAVMSATVFLVVAALLGGVPSSWGVLAIPAAVLGALAFAAPLSACAVDAGERRRRSRSSCASWCSRCSCSRARSSRSAGCPTGSSRWRCCRRCGTRSSCAGRRPPARRRRLGAVVGHVALLLVCLAAGCVVGRAHASPGR